MTTVQEEETRRFTPAELAAMRARGVIGPDEPVELRDGRLTVAGHLRPIAPDEAVALVETGVLDPEEQVELIDGELWIVSPQSTAHKWMLMQLTRVLTAAYRESAWVGVQLPAQVRGPSLPEPDLTVVRPLPTYRDVRADDLLLVMEVMVTSHDHDRRKARIYAESGVAELWLIDVPARNVTVHTKPRSDGTWGSRRSLGEDETLTLPEGAGSLTLRQVLPPASR